MVTHTSSFTWFAAALLMVLPVAPASAQPDNANYRFNSGQPVQPIYEGWQRSRADGTISMFFGYINRNYSQDLALPVGGQNSFSPGPADRGQPTLFYSRIHRQAFSVKLPASWGPKQELTWTITANGATLAAVGWMQPDWEIDAANGGRELNEEARNNKPPTLTVGPSATAVVSAPLTLAAFVADDGLPKPRKATPRAIGQESPPTLLPNPDDPEIPVNVPGAVDPGRGQRSAGPQRLRVDWVAWRGPAFPGFDKRASAEVNDGKAIITATFPRTGTYVLRASASDGGATSEPMETTVTVAPR